MFFKEVGQTCNSPNLKEAKSKALTFEPGKLLIMGL